MYNAYRLEAIAVTLMNFSIFLVYAYIVLEVGRSFVISS